MPHISRRTSALAGVVVGPLWVGVVILVTLLEWDFLRSLGWSPTSLNEVPYPSAIVRGDFGFLQSLNFAAAAALVAVFAIGFRREFRHRISGAVATAGFALFVVGVVINIPPTDLPGEPSTWHGVAHDSGFFVTILGVAIAYSASGLALRGNPAWRGWRWLGWTPLVLVAIAFTGAGLPGDLGFCLFLILIFAWYTVMGAHLLAVDKAETSQRTSASSSGSSSSASSSQLPDAAAPGLL